MKKSVLLTCSLLASGMAFAQQNILNSAVQDLENAEAAQQNAQQNGQNTQQSGQNNTQQNSQNTPAPTPGALVNQVKNAAEQKLLQSAPPAVQQDIGALEAAKQLKKSVSASPGGAMKAVEGQAEQKAAGEALKLLE